MMFLDGFLIGFIIGITVIAAIACIVAAGDSEKKDTPTADVTPVKHGKWLNFYGNYTTAECDVCGECFEVTFEGESNKMLFDAFRQSYRYCPTCGAKMDGGKSDE